MTPLPVDSLFESQPRLFAFKPPTIEERERAQCGDSIKLFVQLDEHIHPRPIWFVVTSVQIQTRKPIFKGEVWGGYNAEKRQRIGEVKFDSSHIYRLPNKQKEIENHQFDPVYRDQKLATS